ncbi:MAG: MerR family transcriptional regulator [Candidatus Gracilibacteria bacterium]|nr:MerR family transcriptional regulator [Candidatus Gracilibacteria bacterium]
MQTYTIKEASKLSGLPESTLRYYEKMGLISGIARDKISGYRVYTEDNLTLIATISCLNTTGMSIGDMKQYIDGIFSGDKTNTKQLDILKQQKKILIEEEKVLALRKKYIDGKIKYWELINTNDKSGVEELYKELLILAKKLKHTR